jgi:hypothetical protein
MVKMQARKFLVVKGSQTLEKVPDQSGSFTKIGFLVNWADARGLLVKKRSIWGEVRSGRYG